ncbi:MAG: hypothetical protein ACI9NT_000688 [Bacteroidia bacterium]
MTDHRLEPFVNVSALTAPHLIDRRLHVVVDASLRDAAQGNQGMVMGIKQHLMDLQWVDPQHKSTAVIELEVGNLQLGSFTTNDHPIFRPVELEGFAGRKDQRNERSFAC